MTNKLGIPELPDPYATDRSSRHYDTFTRDTVEELLGVAYRNGLADGASPKAKKARVTKAEALRPEDVPQGVWLDFIALRKAKGAPLTETAMKLIAKDAEKAGYTLASALEICCARGWQAFRADWVTPQKGGRAGSLGGMNYGDRNGHFD